MEALRLTREDYVDGLAQVAKSAGDSSYLDRFVVEFPDGINTASTMEICRVIQNTDFESKVRLMKLCVAKKNVTVTCPNGDVEKFCLSEITDNLEGFPLFKREPLALIAISDAIYGYILKKYVRLSKAQEAAAQQE